jgi:hypothetical protein
MRARIDINQWVYGSLMFAAFAGGLTIMESKD